MSNVSSITYARIGAILHEIGMVSEEEMHSTLEDAADYANEELEDHYEAAGALEEFGVAVSVHADDIDSIYDDYESLLEDAVEVAGGKVTITDVRITEGEGDFEGGRFDRLEFERNGKPVSISAEHFADDYYDQEAACEAIAMTVHDDDPRSWHYVDFERKPSAGYDSIMVLATRDQAEALHEHLGFTFPCSAPSDSTENSPAYQWLQ
ncbi:hypothetical protein FCH28_23825 [Streptomyces piniterrae]|uniref:Uncharacterized protein n=1 Tax=Streptomyces piniterrae TaxID=2571125 RepID=A0A4U0N916_9ACTN|nr:hypothetical protein [Streptomyces piniterrae]TJZ50315.1 hypothetical protein FCH28_23825 [Streptomyces piniterrae]